MCETIHLFARLLYRSRIELRALNPLQDRLVFDRASLPAHAAAMGKLLDPTTPSESAVESVCAGSG